MKLSKAQLAALTALWTWDFNFFDRKAQTRSQHLGLHRTLDSLVAKGLVTRSGPNFGVTDAGEREIFARTIDGLKDLV